jgi:hypothetical protein
MGPMSIHSVTHPPILAITCEFGLPPAEPEQTKQNQPRVKKYKGKKIGDRIEISDESDHNDNYNVDVGNFVMSLEIVVEGVTYVWVGSIMHSPSPAHFWSLLWHQGKVWEGSPVDDLGIVRLRTELSPGQPFKVSSRMKCKPQYILYVRKDLMKNLP